jgi:ABC-2 type transport system permease protein
MNYIGMTTLYQKEVKRFLNVYNQTLIAPMINSLLLLAIFSLVFQNHVKMIGGISYMQFIIPGLIMMTVIQNAFANTSSTITFGKVLGIIIDMLLPPLSAKELTIALALGGATRGIFSGLSVAAAIVIFAIFVGSQIMPSIHNFWLMIFYLFFSSLLLSLLGMIAGILSDTFDQMSALTSFLITPLSFLSGTFYSISHLPPFWQMVNHFNPFFYIIDGFRYSLTGHADFSIATGVAVILSLNLIFFVIVYQMINRGYRLKS